MNAVVSIGSTIHHRGSFSPDTDIIETTTKKKGRNSRSKDRKEKTRSPILKKKKSNSPTKRNLGGAELRVHIK